MQNKVAKDGTATGTYISTYNATEASLTIQGQREFKVSWHTIREMEQW